MKSLIHPLALVHPGAILGEGCEVRAGAIVEEGVELGPGCCIHEGAILRKGVRLHDHVQVHSYAVLGGPPQDLRFAENISSGVQIGSGTVVREYVTINRATKEGGHTLLGSDCFLMAGSHVGHDGRLGNHVVLANAVLLAGFVEVGDYSFIGGGCGIHQFTRVGGSVMVGGNASLTKDIPPYLMVAERDRVVGLNLVGLRRRGFSSAVIKELKSLYRGVYSAASAKDCATRLLQERHDDLGAEGRIFLEFFAGGKRSVARPRTLERETDHSPS